MSNIVEMSGLILASQHHNHILFNFFASNIPILTQAYASEGSTRIGDLEQKNDSRNKTK